MSVRYNIFYGFMKWPTRLVSRVFFWRSVIGREHWVAGPALVAANHASFLDPPLVGGAAPEQITYLARKDLFGNAVFRTLCYGLDAIPIERNAADFGSIKRILGVLQQGRKVLIFPEGVRTYDGALRRAMPGVGLLVHKARVPVIPAHIYGSFRAWPRHRAFPIPARVAIAFGRPVRFDQHLCARPTRETYQAIADEVMARIAALEPACRAGL